MPSELKSRLGLTVIVARPSVPTNTVPASAAPPKSALVIPAPLKAYVSGVLAATLVVAMVKVICDSGAAGT